MTTVDADLDRFFELSLDLLCIAGFHGFFRRLHRALVRTLGGSTELLTARPFLDFDPSDDTEATRAERKRRRPAETETPVAARTAKRPPEP